MNFEEGSEYAFEDDGFSEASLTETLESPVPHGGRDLAGERMFEHGFESGSGG